MGSLLPLVSCYALSVLLSTVYVSFRTIQTRRVRPAGEGVRNFLILSGHIHYIYQKLRQELVPAAPSADWTRHRDEVFLRHVLQAAVIRCDPR